MAGAWVDTLAAPTVGKEVGKKDALMADPTVVYLVAQMVSCTADKKDRSKAVS